MDASDGGRSVSPAGIAAGIAAVFVGERRGQFETDDEYGSMSVSFSVPVRGMMSFVSPCCYLLIYTTTC